MLLSWPRMKKRRTEVLSVAGNQGTIEAGLQHILQGWVVVGVQDAGFDTAGANNAREKISHMSS